MGYLTIPVSNVDSDSVSISPVENLALVYLRTKSGPQGPNPLRKDMWTNIKQRQFYINKFLSI